MNSLKKERETHKIGEKWKISVKVFEINNQEFIIHIQTLLKQ